jgi:hypothetical protein
MSRGLSSGSGRPRFLRPSIRPRTPLKSGGDSGVQVTRPIDSARASGAVHLRMSRLYPKLWRMSAYKRLSASASASNLVYAQHQPTL